MRVDYHVHSEFSDDSNYPLDDICQDACRLGLDEICITDHVDYGVKVDVSPLDEAGTLFDNSFVSNPADIPISIEGEPCVNVDYQHYFPAIAAAREKWADPYHDWWGGTLTVRCGIELGVQRHTIEQNARLIKARSKELDFVLLSCHQVSDLEFWCGDFQRGKTAQEVTSAYYDELYACAKGLDDWCILAHLDAIKRDNPDDKRPFSAIRDIVAALLRYTIDSGRGIELNTSSVRYKLTDWQPSRDILALYRDLGGTIVTVGSDSHAPAHLGSYLRQATDLLYDLGFPGICTYEHREPCMHRF